MSGDLLANIMAGIFAALVMLGFIIAVIMGIRAIFRKLQIAEPSKGVPGWVWLLGSFIAMGSAGNQSREMGGGVSAVAADFLVLTTLVIAVTLLVRAVVRAIRPREQQQHPDAKPVDGSGTGASGGESP